MERPLLSAGTTHTTYAPYIPSGWYNVGIWGIWDFGCHEEAILSEEDMGCSAIVEEEEEEKEDLTIQTMEEGVVLKNWIAAPSLARRVPE